MAINIWWVFSSFNQLKPNINDYLSYEITSSKCKWYFTCLTNIQQQQHVPISKIILLWKYRVNSNTICLCDEEINILMHIVVLFQLQYVDPLYPLVYIYTCKINKHPNISSSISLFWKQHILQNHRWWGTLFLFWAAPSSQLPPGMRQEILLQRAAKYYRKLL